MKKWVMLLGVLMSLNTFCKEERFTSSVYFQTNKWDLNSKAFVAIREMVQSKQVEGDYEIVIKGYADHRGDRKHNQMLSENRAKTVYLAMLKEGVDPKVVRVSHFGESFSKLRVYDDQKLQEDRRVDIILRVFKWESIDELNQVIIDQNTYNGIHDASNPILIDTKNHAQVRFPAHAFQNEYGNLVEGEIQLRVIEALNHETWAANGLSTISNGRILETGGMIKVEAIDLQGNPLDLADTAQYLISIPQPENRDRNMSVGMQIFNSVDGSNWATEGKMPFDINRIQMPPYPKLRLHKLKLPEYKVDYSSKPAKPRPPMKPQAPHYPRENSYKQPIMWYHINKKARVNRNKKRINDALEKYQKRADRYDLAMSKYDQKRKEYNRNYMEWQCDLEDWEKEQEFNRQNWESTPKCQRLINEHDSLNELYSLIYKRQAAEWTAMRRERVAALGDKMDKMGITNTEMVNNYVSSMKTLGWINIDRFSKLPMANRRDIIIEDTDTTQKRVMLVFRDINSCIHLGKRGNQFVQKDIPRSEPVFVFAYYVKEGKPYVMYEPVGSRGRVTPNYRQSSFAELKEVLASM